MLVVCGDEKTILLIFWKVIWQYVSRIIKRSYPLTYFQQSILGNNLKYWQKHSHKDVLYHIIYSCKIQVNNVND